MASSNRTILLLLGAGVSAAGFHDLANRYRGFRLWDGPPAGLEPHPLELTFDAWYLFFGAILVALLATAIAGRSADVAQIEGRLRRLAASPWLVPMTGLFVLVAALVVKDAVLAGAPVTDDESVYDFIAKTLALGRVKNPVPAFDRAGLELLQTNFVILDEHGWYGKYPIGHPLFLALGEVIGARFVVCPLLAAATAMITVAVARRHLGDVAGAIAALLIATSPQLVCTAATNLSQNTTATMMMVALFALSCAADATGRRRFLLLLGAGAGLGWGFLARPMPGMLFIVAGAAWLVLAGSATRSRNERVVDLVVLGVPVAAFAALLGLSNMMQSGSPFVSGYDTVHGGAFGVHTDAGAFSSSFASALLRQSFWAFGWPCSIVFLPFAAMRVKSERPGLGLVWLMLGAGYAYRLIGPKVFVGTTGPVYVAEMVPLLAILSAAGMIRARAWLAELRPSLAGVPAALAMASSAAAIVMFLPFQLSWLGQVSKPQRFTADTMAATGVKRALVFSNNVTRLRGATWALFPPPPPPKLDEPLIHVRRATGPDAAHQMFDFWRRYFPDRRAFVLHDVGGPLKLRELTLDFLDSPDAGPPDAGPPPSLSGGRK